MVTFKKIKQTVTGKLLVEGECTSTDSKPIDIMANGSMLFEIDTGSRYFFDEGAQSWIKSVRGGAGNITVDDLTVTENGTYTPEDDQHAFGTVTVDVPPPEGYISPNNYSNYDLISVQRTGSAKQFADANRNYKIRITGKANTLFAPFSAAEVYAMLEAGASINATFTMNDADAIMPAYIVRSNTTDYPFFINFSGAKFSIAGDDSLNLDMSVRVAYQITQANIDCTLAYLYRDGAGTIDAKNMLAAIDVTVDITVPHLDGRGLPPYIKEYSDEQEIEYRYEDYNAPEGVTTYSGTLMDIDNATDMAVAACPPDREFAYWSTDNGIRVDDIRDLIGTPYTYTDSASPAMVLRATYNVTDSSPEEP